MPEQLYRVTVTKPSTGETFTVEVRAERETQAQTRAMLTPEARAVRFMGEAPEYRVEVVG